MLKYFFSMLVTLVLVTLGFVALRAWAFLRIVGSDGKAG